MDDEAGLLDAILRDPEDPAPYLVYADWLQARGDARGDFMALQGASDDHPGDHRISYAALDYLRAHAERYLGTLAPFVLEPRGAEYLRLGWRSGFIGSAALHAWDREDDQPTWDDRPRFSLRQSLRPEDVLARLLALDAARFLTHLTIAGVEELGEILGSLAMPALRVLRISGGACGALDAIWRQAPGLRELVVDAKSSSLGTLELPALRLADLAIDDAPRRAALHDSIDSPQRSALLRARAELELSIATARWPQLEVLRLSHGDALAWVATIATRDDLVTLGDLGLHSCDDCDRIFELLARSPIAPQLHRLSLAESELTDRGVAALLAHRDAFPSLAVVDVSGTWVTRNAVARLATMVPDIAAHGLRTGAPFVRPVAKAEADDDD